MSRGELVHQLAQAGARGDRKALQRTMDALILEARAQQQHGYAGRLESVLKEERSKNVKQPARAQLSSDVVDLVIESPARRKLKDLVLPCNVQEDVRDFFHEFGHADLLRANSLEPRHTVLLVGPPGNGKTSLAEVMAAELGLLFLTVRYDAVVDSYLGETAARIRRIIDFATHTPCLLFFDEFDAVAKERGDSHETGEIKRVVSSLLVQMDSLPSHTVVVCATNHPELLDRAVWRRFELKLEVPLPGAAELAEWFRRFERSLGGDLGVSEDEFVRCMEGESFSQVEAFTLDIRRKIVLSMGKSTPRDAARDVLERWSRRMRGASDTGSAHAPRPSDSKAPARAQRRPPKPRAKAALPEKDLLSGPS